MPEAITMPIEKRAAAPGPVAISSGNIANTSAAVVISTGRRRMAAASSIASRLAQALLLQLVGELHDQDAVLGDHADQRHQPDLGVDVERHAGEGRHLHAVGDAEDVDEQQRAADRHRHRHQHDQRIAERFELRRQHQVDDDQRESKGHQQRRAFLLELARGAGVVDLVSRRRHFRGQVFEDLQRLALRHAGLAAPQ